MFWTTSEFLEFIENEEVYLEIAMRSETTIFENILWIIKDTKLWKKTDELVGLISLRLDEGFSPDDEVWLTSNTVLGLIWWNDTRTIVTTEFAGEVGAEFWWEDKESFINTAKTSDLHYVDQTFFRWVKKDGV